ncbi:hypothetical protein BKA69DRAFT_781336 [Paraphysoderma sedebokerense]|nr:hypothetical protein BKA69DRAFT_781336 [Paraphysoderma sedebokerense]
MAKFNFEAISRSQKFLSHYFRTLMPISKKAAESKKEQWVTYMNNATQNAFDSIDHLASKINGQPSIDKFKNGASSKQSSKDPTKRPDLGSTSIMGKFVEDRLIGHLPNAAISSSTSDPANKTTSNAIQALADLSKNFTTSLSSISFPSSLTSLSNSSTLLTGNIFQQTFSSLLLQSKKLLHGMNSFVSSIVVKMIQYIDMMLKLFDNLLEIKLEIPFFSKWWKGVVQNDTKKDNVKAKEDGDGMTVLDLFTWFGAGVFTWDYMAWKSSEPFTSTDMSVLLNSHNPFFFAEDYTRNTLTGVPSEKKRYKFRCKFDWALQATKLSMSLIKVAVALAMEFGSSTQKAALGVLVSVNSFISAGTTYPLTHMTGELSEKTLNKAVDNILPQFWIWWAYAFVPITLYQTRFLNEMVIGRDKIGYFNLAILGVPETVFIILAIKHVVPQINWSDPKRVVGVSFSFASWFLSFVHTFLIASPDPATKMIATTADKLKLLANFGRLQVFMATDLLSLTSSGI